MAESYRDLNNPSPPIETFVEKITQSTPVLKDSYANEFNGKRMKMESDERDIQSMTYCATPMIDDDCEAFGHSVAAQLRQMPRIQKCLAQRLISEICFRGQIQALQMNTCLTSQANLVQQNQFAQFPNVRSYYNNAPDYAVHQNNVVRHLTRIPANINPITTNVHYHSSNLASNLQQPHQSPSPSNNTINSTENMK